MLRFCGLSAATRPDRICCALENDVEFWEGKCAYHADALAVAQFKVISGLKAQIAGMKRKLDEFEAEANKKHRVDQFSHSANWYIDNMSAPKTPPNTASKDGIGALTAASLAWLCPK